MVGTTNTTITTTTTTSTTTTNTTTHNTRNSSRAQPKERQSQSVAAERTPNDVRRDRRSMQLKPQAFKSKPRAMGSRVPWHPKKDAPYMMSLCDLGREVVDYAQYAALTQGEAHIRRGIVDRMRSVVRTALGPDADTTVFGSFSFSLSLCTSDVDIAVDAEHLMIPDADVLEKIAECINPEEFKVDPLLGASVPILKLTHRASGVCVDLSVATEATRPSVAAQAAFLAEFPIAEPIIVVAKALLRQWGLNNVATGGLSSTSLYHLVERFFLADIARRGVASPYPVRPLVARAAAAPPPPAVTAPVVVAAVSPKKPLVSPRPRRCSSDHTPAVSRSSSPTTAASDGDWRTVTQSSGGSAAGQQMATWTPPPSAPSKPPTTPAEQCLFARAFLDFLLYSSNDAYTYGFGLYDRLDPTNEVSRGTTRTLELQALMKHTASVLHMVLQAPRGSDLPPSPLSSVIADIRASQSVSAPGVSVRVGDRVVRS